MKTIKTVVVLAALATAAVLFIKPSDTAESEATAGGASSTSMIPEVAAATPKPSACPAVSCTNQTPTVRGTLPYVLTSKVPIDTSLRLAAESLGAKTVGVVSRNALLVEADGTARARLAADSRFEEITEFVPSSKIQPELAAMIADGAKSVDVSLVALAAADRQIVISCLKHGGGEMLKGCINEGDTIRAKLPADLVATLATRGDVRWMETFVRPRFLNDLAVSNETMNVVSVWDMSRGLGLTGAGQAVSTSDTGIDTGNIETMHKDLRNRVKDIQVVSGCYDYDKDGHGTHTAGSIVGDGAESGGQIKGTAYNADLYAWFCSGTDGYVWTPDTLSGLFLNGGAWTNYIHSASWGSGYSVYAEYNMCGKYTTECAEKDKFVWENPEYLPVFSAGNDGTHGTKTIASPASAKNVLAVGATQNTRKGHDGGWGNGDPTQMAVFSSRGPCLDGRTKPDIAAPGVGILSTRSRFADYSYGVHSNTNYAYDSGTSMSCPLTAGSVALVRQWLVEKRGFADEAGKRPTAALMKAVIMGGAKDAAMPNNDQGWGRVDLANTLAPTNGCAVMLIDRIPFEQGFVTNIVIETTNAAPLDVQLVWVDYPGSASAAQTEPKLVNDLDLTVEARTTGGSLFCYGNGGDEPDTLNNAESVRIESAVPTKYVITVDCKTILYDHRDGGAAALYIRGAFDPNAEPEKPTYVHLKKQDRGFLSLNRALAAVRDDGETVEIYDWVSIGKSATITNDCTFVATNADAYASAVTCRNNSTITVTNGVTLTVSNVVFDAANKYKTVKVLDGGALKVGGVCMLEAVETAAWSNLVVGATLDKDTYFRIDCTGAGKEGETFATATVDYETATNCANRLIHYSQTRLVGEAYTNDAGKVFFRWAKGHPSDAAAVAQTIVGGTKMNYGAIDDAIEDIKNETRPVEIVVQKDDAFKTKYAIKSSSVTLRGAGVPKPVLTTASTAGFEIVTGTALTLKNVTFLWAAQQERTSEYCFINVKGGELTLDDGATLDGIVGRIDYGSGVVELDSGTVTMTNSASIINCEAQGLTKGMGWGGAIYAKGKDCQLNLLGGVITNCFATSLGGGVYTCGYQDATEINVKGNLTIANNRSNGFANDDIYLLTSGGRAGFKVTGVVKGRIGVRYSATIGSGNNAGDSFITNVIGDDVDETTLYSFFSDATSGMVAAKGTGDKAGTLVWAVDPRDPRQCDESEASAKLIAGNEVTFWREVSDALNEATDNSIVEVLKDYTLTNNVTVSGCVTLRTEETKAAALSLVRAKDVSLSIKAGGELFVTNVVFDGYNADGESCTPLFDVCGGALKIDGVTISDVTGGTNRNANAVTVYSSGMFEMKNSQIRYCWNDATDPSGAPEKSANAGAGGGVLVDHATAYLLGGAIANCRATKGGGVFACNGSTVYLGGDMRITGSTTNGVPNNLAVSDSSTLVLSNALTEAIHVSRHLDYSLECPGDTNVVAAVSPNWTNWNESVTALTNSAAKFERDIDGERAVAVTNDTKALIVWCGAVKGGVYTNVSDGVEYVLTGEMPVAAPPIFGYQLTFGTANAFANDPVVTITEMANGAGGITVTVLVKDGTTPVAVDAAKVAALFEVTSDVGDWTKTVGYTVENPVENADNSVTFTVKPVGDPPAVFIRLKY